MAALDVSTKNQLENLLYQGFLPVWVVAWYSE
jgi:hypothetical protein